MNTISSFKGVHPIEDLDVLSYIERVSPKYTMIKHSEMIGRFDQLHIPQLYHAGWNLVDVKAQYDDRVFYSQEDDNTVNVPDARMFLTLSFESDRYMRDETDSRMFIAIRNSVDKSMSFGVAAGAQIICCSNLCFAGSGITIMRRHSKNAFRPIMSSMQDAVSSSWDNYSNMIGKINSFKRIDLENDDAYSILGRMFGNKIIRSTQFTNSVRKFNKPPYEEYGSNNMNTLYQVLTETLEDVAFDKRFDTGMKITSFINNEARKMAKPPKIYSYATGESNETQGQSSSDSTEGTGDEGQRHKAVYRTPWYLQGRS